CFSKDHRKKDRSDSEPDTKSSFQKTPASHWRPTETFHIHIPHPPPTTPGLEEFAIGSAVTKASDN
ncbi:unnamed protein product, partial [Porites lobata]